MADERDTIPPKPDSEGIQQPDCASVLQTAVDDRERKKNVVSFETLRTIAYIAKGVLERIRGP
jgi:hypothetical protein